MKRLHFALGYLLLSPWLLLAACEEDNTPENNFEIFWADYDRLYGQFAHKGIDWDAVYDTYRPRVGPDTGDRALFDIFEEMAAILNDAHVELYGGGRYFQSGPMGQTSDDHFDLRIVKKQYLEKVKRAGEDNFTYGWADKDIGYVHILEMSGDDEGWYKDIDIVLDGLRGAKAMIVDVRGDFGGEDRYAFPIACRFTDKKREIMHTQYRNGPRHDDFGPMKRWYVKPEGPRQFTGPVVVLTNIFTRSAAENFTLAMKALPHVTQMGSTTTGALANTLDRELLNGWSYVVPIGFFTDAKGRSYEGIGFAPDDENQVVNTEEEQADGIDTVLETALARLRGQLDG